MEIQTFLDIKKRKESFQAMLANHGQIIEAVKIYIP